MPQPSTAARTARRPAVIALQVLIVVGILVGLAFNLSGLPPLRDWGYYYRIDLDVYRIGGRVFLDGLPLYGPMPPTKAGLGLPFTYPPLAAISFSPMAWMSQEVAGTIMTFVSIAALAVSILIVLRSLQLQPLERLGWRRGEDRSGARQAPAMGTAWTVAGVLAVSFWLEPVYSTLDFGQVNIVLMTLVLADCLLPKTPWPRGILVGFVAAFKLTPAVFVLFFLMRKDFRAAIWTGIGFVGATAIGFVLAFSDSKEYWTEVVVNSDRIGGPAYRTNQSIVGILARLGWDDVRTPLWLLLALVAFVIALIAMRWAVNEGETTLVLMINAMFGLLASPVSWSHHWVWAVPIVLTLGTLAYRRSSTPLAVWTGIGVVLFYSAPHRLVLADQGSNVGAALWRQLIASSFVWWNVATLVALAVMSWRSGVRLTDVWRARSGSTR